MSAGPLFAASYAMSYGLLFLSVLLGLVLVCVPRKRRSKVEDD